MDEIKNKDEYNPDIVTLSDDDGKEYTLQCCRFTTTRKKRLTTAASWL